MNQNQTTNTELAPVKPSLVTKFASHYGVDSDKMLTTLKDTAFKQKEGVNITNEQMMALLIVADQYKLNPFTREIYAFPDKKNGIIPVVGIDGWLRIINSHDEFDGLELIDSGESIKMDDDAKDCPIKMTCIVYRKDHSHPTAISEYLEECYRPAFKDKKRGYVILGHWQSHTRRALRHKTIIQCARVAFGFGGIYDRDEAERIIEGEIIETQEDQSKLKGVNQLRLNSDKVNTDISQTESNSDEQKTKTNAASGNKKNQPTPKNKTTNAPDVNVVDLINRIDSAKTRDDIAIIEDLANSLPANDKESVMKNIEGKLIAMEKAETDIEI